MDKTLQLNTLARDIETSGTTAELRATAQQLVMGAGNPDASTVFIGEAPGKREDESGQPFVGAAGKFLDVMLDSVNLARDDIYITNIVKYRPPDNRDPAPAEVAAFMPYLARQLEIIQPKLVVTLGRFPMNVFLPNETIGHIHGQPQSVKLMESGAGDVKPMQLESDLLADGRVVLLPLYHPAAALYNGAQRQTLLDDFAQIPQILELLTN
ncbi:MAG: uracil-DNA glycosylase [Candidatus Saccharimonadales bacterium]